LRELEELASRIEPYEHVIEMNVKSASFLVMPRGARILGVDLGNGNLLWVNPRIEAVLLNKEWNTGGIRTWVSPERNFFYDDPEKFDGWRCPRGMDPGKYEVAKKEKSALELKGTISAQDMVSKQTLLGYMSKRIEIQEVHKNEKATQVRLTIHDVLKVQRFESPFALWCLVQVDPGESGEGIVTVPVVRNAKLINYFDPIPSNYLQVLEDRVEFALDGNRELKLGIRPEDLQDPRVAELRYSFVKAGSGVSISLSSRTAAKSQSECPDPARSNPTGTRGVIQLYNSELTSSGMRYGELEIQGALAKTSTDLRVAELEVGIDFRRECSSSRMCC
jgi:hypothetical protein